MKIVILTFSPTGNTARAGKRLGELLLAGGAEVEYFEIAKNRMIFEDGDYKGYLRENIPPHDLLCLGAPVYACHMQYHMLELIDALPPVGGGWSRLVFPFVTYGHVDSGVALEEAARRLRKRGRVAFAGMKLDAVHTMLGSMTGRKFGPDVAAQKVDNVIRLAAQRITGALSSPEAEVHAAMRYQSAKTRILAKVVFVEKLMHNWIYPTVELDEDKCTKCGICVSKCPVNHLGIDSSGSVRVDNENKCIHCFSCIANCPAGAVGLNKSQESCDKVAGFIDKKGYEAMEESLVTE